MKQKLSSSSSAVEMEWLDLRQLTRYAAVSERTLREWIHSETNPLPASRVHAKLLVRRRDFDRWLESHRLKPSSSVDGIVDELLAAVRR